jgi:uncharacterized protein (TIGR02466 family)
MFKQATRQLTEAWPTIVLRHEIEDCDDINASLAKEILLRATSEASAKNSNADSWQSRHADFLHTKGGSRQFLIAHATKMVEVMTRLHGIDDTKHELSMEAWCVVSRTGNHHNHHIHGGSVWSGVYYVTVPRLPKMNEESHPGAIEFIDPRLSRPCDATSSFVIQPCAGLMILFPSWLVHWVKPHYSSAERICIPFNISIR